MLGFCTLALRPYSVPIRPFGGEGGRVCEGAGRRLCIWGVGVEVGWVQQGFTHRFRPP